MTRGLSITGAERTDLQETVRLLTANTLSDLIPGGSKL